MTEPGLPRHDFLGTPIDDVNLERAIDWIRARADESGPTLLVHTVNVDHIVLARRNASFADVARDAGLSVADGMPLVWGSRILGFHLPERVTGVDLFTGLVTSSGPKLPLYMLGAQPDIARRAADVVNRIATGIELVGVLSPGPEELADPAGNSKVVQAVNDSGAAIVAVAFGAPKQELWLAQNATRLRPRVGIGVGGTFDFLAGEVRRAPDWMRRSGLEWLHRLASDPRRLAKRYLLDDPVFVWWLLRAGMRRMLGAPRGSSR
jgi:N-acetylglucosaminyldiphosphoundecaprenol N-acetyl-beta-D-mannosaminyltransferase